MMPTAAGSRRRLTSADAVIALLLAVLAVRLMAPGTLGRPVVAAWATIFTAVCVQATPYLVLGAVVSAVLTVVVTPAALARALPRRLSSAVPVAALAGAALPGCECGSVPVGAAMMRGRVRPAAAIAFLLAAPAVNPVVVVATASAFPHRPVMVLARVAASFATAVVVGWAWQSLGRDPPARLRTPQCVAVGSGEAWADAVTRVAIHDLGRAAGMLVVGAAAAATVQVTMPRTWLDGLSGSAIGGLAAMVTLAVLTAVCSEADAFVAASFVRFAPVAQLAFMVVGPVVDVKLIALHIGTFGRRFAARLVPLTLGVAVGCTVIVGRLLL